MRILGKQAKNRLAQVSHYRRLRDNGLGRCTQITEEKSRLSARKAQSEQLHNARGDDAAHHEAFDGLKGQPNPLLIRLAGHLLQRIAVAFATITIQLRHRRASEAIAERANHLLHFPKHTFDLEAVAVQFNDLRCLQRNMVWSVATKSGKLTK